MTFACDMQIFNGTSVTKRSHRCNQINDCEKSQQVSWSVGVPQELSIRLYTALMECQLSCYSYSCMAVGATAFTHLEGLLLFLQPKMS